MCGCVSVGVCGYVSVVWMCGCECGLCECGCVSVGVSVGEYGCVHDRQPSYNIVSSK